jgi:hypothetical protein
VVLAVQLHRGFLRSRLFQEVRHHLEDHTEHLKDVRASSR